LVESPKAEAIEESSQLQHADELLLERRKTQTVEQHKECMPACMLIFLHVCIAGAHRADWIGLGAEEAFRQSEHAAEVGAQRRAMVIEHLFKQLRGQGGR